MSLMEEKHGSGSMPPPAKGAEDGQGSGTVEVVPTGVLQKTCRHELVPELRFPPGYHFLPTEEELVDVYLRAKIEGRAPPLDVIKEVEILKSEPHVLVGTYKPYGESKWFFFTRREKSASNKENQPRRQLYCTDGVTASWKATGRVATILRSSGTGEPQIIGTKRILIYHSNVADEDDKWSMNEYVMADYPGIDQWVLCTIQTKLSWDNNSKSPKKKHKKEGEHITNMKPKITKRRKKTATSQAQEETAGTFDVQSAHSPPLLTYEHDPHHQDLHEKDYSLALDNKNTSLILDHPTITGDHHQTLLEDYCQLEDLLPMHQQVTYDMPNNLHATPLITYHCHHHSADYQLARYQSQELVSFEYQSWEQQQQEEEMPHYNNQVGMQVFVGNIAAGSISRQKQQDTSSDSVVVSVGDPYGDVSEHYRTSFTDNYDNTGTIVPMMMMSGQAGSPMCPHAPKWWGVNTCLCVQTSRSC